MYEGDFIGIGFQDASCLIKSLFNHNKSMKLSPTIKDQVLREGGGFDPSPKIISSYELSLKEIVTTIHIGVCKVLLYIWLEEGRSKWRTNSLNSKRTSIFFFGNYGTLS